LLGRLQEGPSINNFSQGWPALEVAVFQPILIIEDYETLNDEECVRNRTGVGREFD
jgi:hypothetical protein